MTETHDLVTYQSLGETRGLTLTYDSLRADPRPIFHVGYDDIDPDAISIVPDGLRVVARVGVFVDNVEIASSGFDQPGQFGLQGGENFFSIPTGSGPLDVAVQVDLSEQPTGIYPYRFSNGIRNLVETPFGTFLAGSQRISSNQMIHVNSVDSPFGSGWGMSGLLEIHEGDDGSVAIIDGNGSEVRFTPGARQVQDFLAPDVNNNAILRVDGLTGGVIDEFVTSGSGGLTQPHNPTFGPDGNLYVVSASGPRILRFDGETGDFLDIFVNAGEGGFGGAAEQAFSPDGDLYLATVGDRGVLRYDRFGNFLDSIAGPADGVQQACGIEFGPDGNLYVYDTLDEEMRRFDPITGDLIDVFIPAGNMQNACDFDFGPDGDIFITDLNFNQIRRFAGSDGAFVEVFANTGPGASGITTGPDGDFYVNVAGDTHRFRGETGEFVDVFVQGIGGFNNFFPPPPEDISQEYINPPGDFSDLQKLPGGTFQQTTPDKTVLTFNQQNKLARVEDRNGNTTRYEYDGNGNITKIIDPVGLETTFAYRNSRVISITDPADRVTELDYDSEGNLVAITDPDNSSRRFGYDQDHRMVHEVDKRGNEEFDYYDDFGRLTRSQLGDGSQIRVTPRQVQGLYRTELVDDPFDAQHAARTTGGNSTYVDPNGNTTSSLLDSAGQLISGQDNEGQRPSFLRDPVTNLVQQIVDARGNVTTLTHDERGNLTSLSDSINPESPQRFTYDPIFSQVTSSVDELGRLIMMDIDPANGNTRTLTQVIGEVGGADDLVTNITYLPNGLIDTLTDPLGRVTDFDFDDFGRLTRVTNAKGTNQEAIRQFEYDNRGNTIRVIDENGNISLYEYDLMDRIVKIVSADPDGEGPLSAQVTTMSYDAAGNLLTMTDALGNTTRFEYDARDRQTKMVDSNLATTAYNYDNAGNLISMIDQVGQETQYVYDTRDRMVQRVAPDNGIMSFSYDEDNNLLSVTDPNGNTTEFRYDARNRLTREAQVGTGVEKRFAYDAVDNLVETTDRNGQTTELSYDELNRVITENWIDGGNTIQYSYDRSSNLLSVADEFSSLTFTYDDRNRIETLDNVGTPGAPRVTLTYSYDDLGRIETTVDNINGSDAGVTNYQYDTFNRLTSIRQNGTGVAGKRVDFSYNLTNRYTSIERYDESAGNGLVARSTFSYDALNRLTSLSHHQADTAMIAFTELAYDDAHRIVRRTNVDGTTDYTYSSKDELLSANHSHAAIVDEVYQYDQNGNRLRSHRHDDQYTTEAHNRLVSDGIYTYEYDAEGNLKKRIHTGTHETREFFWDHRNRLISVVDKDGSESEIQRVEFTYDAIGRRISKNVVEDGQTSLTHFIYDGFDVLLEYEDADGMNGPQQPTFSTRYLHGLATDQVLAREDAAGQVAWYLTDHLGSVTDLIDNQAEVLNHVTYDSYGNILSQTNPEMPNRYFFTGREFDDEIDLYYHRARFYDPALGQFISEDPIGFFGRDTNLYGYVGRNPVSRVDSHGLQSPLSDAGWAVLGAAVEQAFVPGPLQVVWDGVQYSQIGPKYVLDNAPGFNQFVMNQKKKLIQEFTALPQKIKDKQKDVDKKKKELDAIQNRIDHCVEGPSKDELRRQRRAKALELAKARSELTELKYRQMEIPNEMAALDRARDWLRNEYEKQRVNWQGQGRYPRWGSF